MGSCLSALDSCLYYDYPTKSITLSSYNPMEQSYNHLLSGSHLYDNQYNNPHYKLRRGNPEFYKSPPTQPTQPNRPTWIPPYMPPYEPPSASMVLK